MSAPLPRVLLVLGIAGLFCLSASFAEEEPLDDTADEDVPFGEQVNQAIARGSKWLLARPDLFLAGGVDMAHWGLIRGARLYGGGEGEGYGHPAGATAFALYTLLKCGVDPEHPVVQRGFHWLRKAHPITQEYDGEASAGGGWQWSHREGRGSYELSAEILALCAKYDAYKRTKNTKLRRSRGKLKIKDKDDREWLEELVAALVARRGIPDAAAPPAERRGWRYNLRELTLQNGRQTRRYPLGPPPPNANQDLSSTQLAALALFSAHQFDVAVEPEVWVDVALFTLDHQEGGGAPPPAANARGFVYIKGSPDDGEGTATGSMTACGIANLLMAKDVLLESAKGQKRWKENGLEQRLDQAVHDGIAWLDLHWSAFDNPGRGGYHLYYLYAVERAMDLFGKQLVGKHVWYLEGARQILAKQMPVKVKDPVERNAPEVDGTYWNTESTHQPQDVLDTCFALLFLKRATQGLAPTVTASDR